MDSLIIAAILAIGLCRLLTAHREGRMASEYIALGAIAGSLIAAWFRRSARWLFQIVAGSWIGYVSGHWIGDYMGWPVTSDYQLLAGTIMGCIGYSILEIMLSKDLWETIKGKIRGRAE